jgi:hypothetical protein
VTGDAEKTNDRRQTHTKLGSSVLGAWKETHNSLVAFLLYYSLLSLCSFSLILQGLASLLFFKTLLLKSFLFFKVSFRRLALSRFLFLLS